MKQIVIVLVVAALLLNSCGSKSTNESQRKITAEMAYEGVSNYCHSAYDWSIAKENPSIMYVQMGEETDSAYQVVFRSYTGHSSISMSIKPVTQREWKNMFLLLMSEMKPGLLIYTITSIKKTKR